MSRLPSDLFGSPPGAAGAGKVEAGAGTGAGAGPSGAEAAPPGAAGAGAGPSGAPFLDEAALCRMQALLFTSFSVSWGDSKRG